MLWTFKDSSWEQDDTTKKFMIRSIFGQNCDADPVAQLDLLIGAKRHSIQGAPCEQSLFPPDFLICPYCGSKLLSPNDDSSALWVPPYGAGNGLKLFPIKSRQNKTAVPCNVTATKFILPSQDGSFAFCTIKLDAKQRLLVAIKRDIGQLWVYRPADKKWEMLSGSVGGDSLPVWSWSIAVASSESGFCLPTNDGPVWVTVNWASGSIQYDRAEGKSVGGAIHSGKYVLAPVMRGDRFSIVCRKEEDTAWSECSPLSDPTVVFPQLRRNPSQDAYMGIPVIDENRQIAYWPCRGGYVRVFGGDSPSGLSWEFRPYETDEYPATALIELGPPYRRTGARPGFWQLCEDRDQTVRDGIVNKIIKLDGDESIDSEIVECGQFLTTGRASFSWGDDYWDDIQKRNSRISEQVELRFPLLQFGDKGLALIAKVSPWEGRDELGVFTDLFFNRGLKASTFVRFVVEGAGVPEKSLYAEGVDGIHGGTGGSLFRVNVAELSELSTFVYGESLYIYFPETNDCFCWPLELVEG